MPTMIDDGTDPERWHMAHGLGISASSIPKAMTPAGRRVFVHNFLHPKTLDASVSKRMDVYMAYGRQREDEFIGAWIEKRFDIAPNKALFASDINPRFLATPDGWDPILRQIAEFKTSTTPAPRTIKREHRDQMTAQCIVMGTERCLYVHEQHEDFTPVNMPVTEWFYPDPERRLQIIQTMEILLFEIDLAKAAA